MRLRDRLNSLMDCTQFENPDAAADKKTLTEASLLSRLQKITKPSQTNQMIFSQFYNFFNGHSFEKTEQTSLPPTPLCRFRFTHDSHYILTPMCLHRAAPEFSKLVLTESATGISFKIQANSVHTLKKLRNQYEPHCSSHFAINIF